MRDQSRDYPRVLTALPGPRGEAVTESSFYLFFNAGSDPVTYVIPHELVEPAWEPVLDTALGFITGGTPCASGVSIEIAPHSLQLHRRAAPVAGSAG